MCPASLSSMPDPRLALLRKLNFCKNLNCHNRAFDVLNYAPFLDKAISGVSD